MEIKRIGNRFEVNRDDLAAELRAFRLRAGLTQKELGEKWNLSRYTIMRAETSKELPWSTAYVLAVKIIESTKLLNLTPIETT